MLFPSHVSSCQHQIWRSLLPPRQRAGSGQLPRLSLVNPPAPPPRVWGGACLEVGRRDPETPEPSSLIPHKFSVQAVFLPGWTWRPTSRASPRRIVQGQAGGCRSWGRGLAPCRGGPRISSSHARGCCPHHQLGSEAGPLRDQSCEYPAPRGAGGRTRPRGCGAETAVSRVSPIFSVPSSPQTAGCPGLRRSSPRRRTRGTAAFACKHFRLKSRGRSTRATGVCGVSETVHGALYELLNSFQLGERLKSCAVTGCSAGSGMESIFGHGRALLRAMLITCAVLADVFLLIWKEGKTCFL